MKIRRLSPLSVLPSPVLPALVLLCLALLSLPLFAQDTPEVLRPPKGKQMAIVVFEDLQCPQCGHLAPLLADAARTYKIPLVQHDFPLPMHNWSFDAAVLARFFDVRSKEIGDDFRAYVFAHQLEIVPQNLREFAGKFAADHKIALPFVVDPDGKLAALVKADRELGKGLHLQHTPTVYVVGNNRTNPFVEVKEPQTELFSVIDAMKKDQEPPPPPAKTASHPHVP
jgi:hypothetical protein